MKRKHNRSKIKKIVVRTAIFTAIGITLLYAHIDYQRQYGISQDIIIQTAVARVDKKDVPEILKKICKAESGCSHLDKNGQVLINKTQDAGKYQINIPIWGKKASEMKLNLFVEKDNETFAIWLLENYGSVPWDSSKRNWNR